MKNLISSICLLLFLFVFSLELSASEFSELPKENGSLLIPAQSWPVKPGPRTIRVYIYYPSKKMSNIDSQTGVMLSLHNWGGMHKSGTANPQYLADRFNVVTICVDYVQSGKKWKEDGPYDFGYFQSLDALRALYFVFNGLKTEGTPFASNRIYCTGGSGGGNLTLMTNKLAPRTFACSIDMCGMARLTDDIAFGIEKGSFLNAGYNRDPKNPNYLSPDRQQFHQVGNPDHLQVMKKLGNKNKLIVVHGRDDVACLFIDAKEMVENMQTAKLDVEPHFIGKKEIDHKIFTSSGHSLGNRTLIVSHVADTYLKVDGEKAKALNGPTDFERKETIIYPTKNGSFEISYVKGYPVGRFVPKSE